MFYILNKYIHVLKPFSFFCFQLVFQPEAIYCEFFYSFLFFNYENSHFCYLFLATATIKYFVCMFSDVETQVLSILKVYKFI
jgi:hypothetical protein